MDRYTGGVPSTGTLRPRGWYAEPRDRGVEARATRAHYDASTTNRVAPVEPVYPPARLRVEEVPEFDEVFDRAEGQRFTNIATLNTATFLFSGVPDEIEITAEGQPTLAQFFDQNLVSIVTIEVPGGQTVNSRITARQVIVTNLGAAAANIAVWGKWRRPFPLEARQADIGAPH